MSDLDEDARLAAAGVHVVTDDENPLVRAECIRIARRLHGSGNKVFGFFPATDDVAVPPVAIQLGVAMTELTGATAAFVDANVRYPALTELARDEAADEEGSVYRTTWLRGSLALLTPPHSERAGEAVPQLARVILDGTDLFEHVLCDLTGFHLLGEHSSAAACMDGVILVGRRLLTREQDLLDMRASLPANRFMGVLLVG